MSDGKPWARVDSLRTDCRWFRGDLPCRPHKESAVHCIDEKGSVCPQYDPLHGNVLIIKLGAIGDVIRTTPIVRHLRTSQPRPRIWWLTLTPEIISSVVDVALPFTPQSLAILQAVSFDALYNLDKDREACALASILTARLKKGFTLVEGVPAPIDGDAHHKFMTGVFDDLSQENTKSYPAEIFEVCGFPFQGEQYILEAPRGSIPSLRLSGRVPVIGLNTGCGGRWITRLWPERFWIALAKRLKKAGYAVVLLGGEQEHKKNTRIARMSGAQYPGYFPLGQFLTLVNTCDLVVTAVTMALHIAIGLRKKVVLFNNIFNRNEFDLYGLGEILEPEGGCSCYYAPTCTDPRHEPNGCMQSLSVDRVFRSITRLQPKS